MLVKIIKENKKYKNGEYIFMCPREAGKYIKKGFAEECKEYWLPRQLYVVELFTATRIQRGHATEGVHERWAIVIPYEAGIPEYRTLTETKYRHVLTGASFKESSPERNLWGAEGLNQIVVNSHNIKPFADFFMDYMIQHDVDANTILFREDIKKLENAINKTRESASNSECSK